METEMSQELQLETWKLKKPVIQFQSEPEGLRTRRGNGAISSMSLNPKAGEDWTVPTERWPVLVLFGSGQSALSRLPIQMLLSSRILRTNTPRKMFYQISRHLVAQSSLYIKLTILLLGRCEEYLNMSLWRIVNRK